MHSLMKCSGRWLFPPTTCERLHQSWPLHHTCNQLFLAIFHLLSNMFFQTENVSATGSLLLSKEHMPGLQIATQERISVADSARMMRRTESRRQRLRYIGSVCYMGHKKYCKINTLVLFLVKFCIYKYTESDFALFDNVICFLERQGLQWSQVLQWI